MDICQGTYRHEGRAQIPNLQKRSQEKGKVLAHAKACLKECWGVVGDNVDS